MNQPLAVIGLACRFPGGIASPSQFWELLRSGRDVIGDLPHNRWEARGWFHPDPSRPGKSYASKGGFCEGVDLFDAEFFGISPREASRMDPQQRLLLEMTWEALEDAGQVPERLAGSNAAVIFGLSSIDYQNLQFLNPESVDAYSNSGCSACISANRVSYFFDFRGPSYVLDTACSAALVALHNACETIWSGRAGMAVTGGIHLLFSPLPWVGFSKARMLSPSGRCRVFDADADGFVRSEGGGVLVIKTLAQAQTDGDPIRALILASGTNCDGRTSALSVPSAGAQETLLREVYGRAGVQPAEVSFVEAHGTGTAVGDPIECEALGRALGSPRSEPLRVGSVKTNLGHMEGAAGIAGAMKVILALEHREIPRGLHFNTPNPQIPFAERNLEVVTRHLSLAEHPRDLVMGVNSSGFGGANAHAVFKEYRPAAPPRCARAAPGKCLRALPLLLSARNPEALRRSAQNHAHLLAVTDAPGLYDICYTAALRRSHHSHRLAVFGSSAEEFSTQLEGFAEGRAPVEVMDEKVLPGSVKPVFVFSGNGSQWPGMGRELLAGSPVFREALEELDSEFQKQSGWSVCAALVDPSLDQRIRRAEIAQPLLFALQLGLLKLLESYGLSPQAVVGHSVGEIAAAYAAGIYSLEQSVHLIHARSGAQALAFGRGRVAVTGLSAETAAPALARFGGALGIASINSPFSTTVSGDTRALTELGVELEARSVFFRMLEFEYPFHSHLLEDLREPLLERLRGLRPGCSRIPFFSTTTGNVLAGEEMDAEYWWQSMRQPSLLHQALEQLIRSGHSLFLEVGPHPVLRTYIRQCLEAAKAEGRVVETLRREQPEVRQALAAIGRCHAAGCALDMRAIFPTPGRPVSLPSYPWQRERHWNGGIIGVPRPPRGEFQHPLLGYRSRSADPLWENEIETAELPYLADHRLLDAAVFPFAAVVEMTLKAAELSRGWPCADVEELEMRSVLTVPEDQTVHLQFSICSDDGSFRLCSRDREDSVWTLKSTGRFVSPAGRIPPEPVRMAELLARTPVPLSLDDFYRRAELSGLHFGSAFRRLREIWVGPGEAVGRIAVDAGTREEGYSFHPTVLDGCFQVAGAAIRTGDAGDAAFLPSQIHRLRLFAKGDRAAFCHARIERRSPRSVVLSVRILDEEGAVVALLEGFRLHRLETANAHSGSLPLLNMRAVLQPHAESQQNAGTAPIDRAGFAEAVRSRMGQAPMEEEAERRAVRALADEVAGRFAWEALKPLLAGKGTLDIASLAEYGRVAVDRLPLLRRLAELAGEDGYLRREGTEWVVTGARPEGAAADAWRRVVADFPAYLAEYDLVGRGGAALAGVLGGGAAPFSLPGQDGGSPSFEHLWDQAPSAQAVNRAIRAAVSEAVERWPAERMLRVLEIGGDAGPCAIHVLPLLPADRTEYWFTHASATVADRAAAQFANFPFVHTAPLDITRDLAGQGFAERGFDLVIASGALHAGDALARMSALGRPGSLFLLVEPQPQRFFDLTLGLLHPTSQLRDGREWARLLQEHGFEHATVLVDCPSHLAASSVLVGWRQDACERETPPIPFAGRMRSWVLLADGDPAAFPGQLAERLTRAGQRVIRVLSGARYERVAEDLFVVPIDEADAFRRLFVELSSEGVRCDEVIHAWGLAQALPESAAELEALTSRRCIGALSLAQGLGRAELPMLPQLWLLTHSAQPVAAANGKLNPAHGSLWGLGRVLATEMPGLPTRLVDLHWDGDPSAVLDRLTTELDKPGPENEIILTQRARYVHRLSRGTLGERTRRRLVQDEQPSYRVALARTGSPEHLILEQCERPVPGPGQVEIRVHAAGLNFHDLALTMNLLPDEAVEEGLAGPALGLECAGEIVRVGEGVSGFCTGDKVAAIAPQCFRAFVVVEAARVLRMPPGMSDLAAATLPTVFATVIYALEHLGRVQRGERILIHGAAGGIGLAAIQHARHVGAELFATAGTEEKREFLRLLGVEHVFSSRTTEFAGQIMQATNGEGVDLVLNAIPGEAVERSFSVLRPFGRFLELGKRDFLEHNRMAMAPFRNNLSYFGIDMDQALQSRPGLGGEILSRIQELLSQGALRPLPFRAFPVSRARDAFRHMQKARHIGKIVISFDDEDIAAQPDENVKLPLRPDGTYLVAGGLSGLGLATARWMARKGVRHLVLVSRSGPGAPEAAAAVAELRSEGCEVLAASVDVTNEGALSQLLAEVFGRMPPLRGVVHSAMVLEDAMLPAMTAEQFWTSAKPKILGAWNLHLLTLEAPLDFFVVYSSAAATVGNPGQANYAAGNMFLESLAHYRRTLGLCGTAIAWGAISDTGYLARNSSVRETLETRFVVRPTSVRQALRYLERILADGGPHWIAADMEWARLSSALARSPRFSWLVEDGGESEPAATVEDMRARLQALPADQARQLVTELLSKELARVVGTTPARIAPDRPMTELGIDSLMAVELLTAIDTRFHAPITSLDIAGGATVSQLAERIVAAEQTAPQGVPERDK